MDVNTIFQGLEAADVVIAALAANTVVTESLPFLKKIKSNSTLQLCFNIIKAVVDVVKKNTKTQKKEK